MRYMKYFQIVFSFVFRPIFSRQLFRHLENHLNCDLDYRLEISGDFILKTFLPSHMLVILLISLLILYVVISNFNSSKIGSFPNEINPFLP